MATQVTNYQCPTCTGPLHFDSESGRLVCDYCGSSFTPEEIEKYYSKKDEKAAEAFQKEEAKADQEKPEEEPVPEDPVVLGDTGEQADPWDASDISSDWGAESEGMRAYSCPSCGAELLCDETTAATSCPYCGNPTIIPGQFAGTLKPDYIIPFKYDQKQAESTLKNFYRGKFLLPGAFTKESHIREIKGIYVPFWLFDGSAAGEATFRATRVRSYRRGDYEITETDHFQVYRSGSLDFEKLPADGATKMPDGHMDAIEPFNYQEMKPFSTAYLPGYLADKYDVTAKENIPRIERRVKKTALAKMEQTVNGFASCTYERDNLRIHQGKVSYALLPVWMLTTRWGGKNYLFAMNGQTGKIVGDLPVSMAKLVGLFFGLTAVLTTVLSFFMM